MGHEMIENLRRFVSWKIVFHVSASSFYLYLVTTTYSSGANVMLVERMVTTWYLTVHISFIFVALGLDFIQLYAEKSNKMVGYLARFNNIIFISVVFPFGLFVPLTYWSLFYYNCNLILPNVVEITVPNWVSTTSHTVISLVVVVEMVTTEYTYKGNYIAALTTLGVFSMSYILCLFRTYIQFGFWVYPVLHMVPEEDLWMVFLALVAKVVVLFFAGAGISFLIHEQSSNNCSSNLLENQTKSDSVNPATESVSDRGSGSSIDGGKSPPFTLKFKSSTRYSTLPKQLRDFSIANGHKIDESSQNDPEIWHDAVYSPAVASFVENSSRKVLKPKKIYRRRIGNTQIELPGRMNENQSRLINTFLKPGIRDDRAIAASSAGKTREIQSRPNNCLKPSIRDDQRVIPATGKMRETRNNSNNFSNPSIRDDQQVIPALEAGKVHKNRNCPNEFFKPPIRDDQQVIPASEDRKMQESRNQSNNFSKPSIRDDQQVIPASTTVKIYENQNRPNVSKPLMGDDLATIPTSEKRKVQENRNYLNHASKPSTRDDQQIIPTLEAGKLDENQNCSNHYFRHSIQDYEKVISAPAAGKMHENQNRPNISKLPIRDYQPAIPTSKAVQGCFCSAAKPSFLLSDRMNGKVNEVFRSTDPDLSMTNIPAPIMEEDLPMDSLESTICTPLPSLVPPSMALENKRKKMKKTSSLRKEKSKSNVSLLCEDDGIETKSAINPLPSVSPQKDAPKIKQEKEPLPESSKIDTCVSGKKDKKKKEDKGPKRISKDPVKKTSLTDTRSDGWTYREITSRRGTGKLDLECLEFETQSLPTNVDREIDGKKRDYQRDSICDEITSSIVLHCDEL